MAGLKEIKRRIKSVENTKKITYAMKLVSAAKLRKVQDKLMNARDYTAAIDKLLKNIVNDVPKETSMHPLLKNRKEVKNVLFIVIGGRRGLSGAYNSNLNRFLEKSKTEFEKESNVQLMIIGRKPADYCKRMGYSYFSNYVDLADKVEEWPITKIFKEAEGAFINGKVDEVYLLYTQFASAMSAHPQIERLLPFSTDALPSEGKLKKVHDAEEKAQKTFGITLYKPSADAIFKVLIPKYAQAKFLLACLEAKASEQGCRMTAMDAATHNASELINALVLTHNKLRQSGITNDILDIIGGSNATKE